MRINTSALLACADCGAKPGYLHRENCGAASPVQGTASASFATDFNASCTVTDTATSSASGAHVSRGSEDEQLRSIDAGKWPQPMRYNIGHHERYVTGYNACLKDCSASGAKGAADGDRCSECGLHCKPGNCIYAAESDEEAERRLYEATVHASRRNADAWSVWQSARALADRSPAVQPVAAVRDAVEKAANIMFQWAGLSDPEQQRKCYKQIMALATPAPEQEAAPQPKGNCK